MDQALVNSLAPQVGTKYFNPLTATDDTALRENKQRRLLRVYCAERYPSIAVKKLKLTISVQVKMTAESFKTQVKQKQ